MIEALYFQCYYAYLMSDLHHTQMYYDILKEEFKIKGAVNSLKTPQLLELKRIKNALDTGCIALHTWVDEQNIQGPDIQPVAGISQDDLVRKITQNSGQLNSLLQDNLSLYNLEHPCDPYGQVDMVFMGENTVYPIEIKKDQGKHDLIGQIYKYDLYHKFHLHYKQYENVQSVTICSSYEPYTSKSLKQLGYKTLVYSLDEEKLKLSLT